MSEYIGKHLIEGLGKKELEKNSGDSYIIVRHGESTSNVKAKEGGAIADAGLTEEGMQEAKDFGRYLIAENKHVASLSASQKGRSLLTAYCIYPGMKEADPSNHFVVTFDKLVDETLKDKPEENRDSPSVPALQAIFTDMDKSETSSGLAFRTKQFNEKRDGDIAYGPDAYRAEKIRGAVNSVVSCLPLAERLTFKPGQIEDFPYQIQDSKFDSEAEAAARMKQGVSLQREFFQKYQEQLPEEERKVSHGVHLIVGHQAAMNSLIDALELENQVKYSELVFPPKPIANCGWISAHDEAGQLVIDEKRLQG